MQPQERQQVKVDMMNEDDDLDDLDDLPDLFHKSSLKERSDPEMEIFAEEVYSVKKIYDSHNNTRINQYVEVKQLGKGAFGLVSKVERVLINEKDERQYKPTGEYFAMKAYSKVQLRGQRFFAPDGGFADALQMLDNQISIVKRLSHPNIVKCYQILHGSDKVYMIMQLGDLGELMKWNTLQLNYSRNPTVYDYLCKKYSLKDKIDITRIIFLQVCQAISYLHSNDITNRDIKVDNMLCRSDTPLGQEIKITDFTTIRYNKDDISFFASGTPGFRGPEHQFASSDGYSCKASDIWSIGVSMYTYYHQNFPFYGETELQIDIKAQNQPLVYEQSCPPWFKDLLQKMCHKQWKKRIDIDATIKILKESQ